VCTSTLRPSVPGGFRGTWTWGTGLPVQQLPRGLNREHSYPSIHQGPDGALNIAHTYFRQAIKFVRVDPQWAVDGSQTHGGLKYDSIHA
jgi:hypothetical protein